MTLAKLSQLPLVSANDTAAHMVELVKKYSSDIGEKSKWPLPKFYRFVRSLEFRADPTGHESIARPALTMSPEWPWRDCDDKAIILGCWFYQNKIPFRFRASSKAADGTLHHVYVMAKIKGKYIPIDATYPRNQLGKEEIGLTRKQDLTGDIMESTLNIFEGSRPMNINTELMGASFLSRMKRKTTNVVKKIAKVPGLKESVAAMVPGGSIMLAKARAVNKIVNPPKVASLTAAYPMVLPEPIQEDTGSKKKLYIGLGVGAVVLAALVISRKKKGS